MRQNYYSQVDANLAEVVRQTAEKIYTQSDFPIQVTRRILVAQVCNAILTKKSHITLSNLPMTSQALKEVMETDAAFIWRKLRWTVQIFLTEPAFPALHTFLRRARISSLILKHPVYKPLIQFAYNNLRTRTLLNEQMPEDLIKRSPTTLSDNETVREAAHGSLASVFMEKQPILLKPLKRQKGTHMS